MAAMSEDEFDAAVEAVVKPLVMALLQGAAGIEVRPLGGEIKVGEISAPASLAHGFTIKLIQG